MGQARPRGSFADLCQESGPLRNCELEGVFVYLVSALARSSRAEARSVSDTRISRQPPLVSMLSAIRSAHLMPSEWSSEQITFASLWLATTVRRTPSVTGVVSPIRSSATSAVTRSVRGACAQIWLNHAFLGVDPSLTPPRPFLSLGRLGAIERVEALLALFAPIPRVPRQSDAMRRVPLRPTRWPATRSATHLRSSPLRPLLARVPGALRESALLLEALQAPRSGS
jgi:hypothetical protein